jgi:hypothetical protein
LVFQTDASAGDMCAFADTKGGGQYHYGAFISGSTLGSDVNSIFSQVRSNVGEGYEIFMDLANR